MNTLTAKQVLDRQRSSPGKAFKYIRAVINIQFVCEITYTENNDAILYSDSDAGVIHVIADMFATFHGTFIQHEGYSRCM